MLGQDLSHVVPHDVGVADDGGVVDDLAHAVHHEHDVRDVGKAIWTARDRNEKRMRGLKGRRLQGGRVLLGHTRIGTSRRVTSAIDPVLSQSLISHV